MHKLSAIALTAFNVLYANYAVNGFASVVTLCVMYSMWKAGHLNLNLYTKIVIKMTCFQTMYDLVYPMHVAIMNQYNTVPFGKNASPGQSSTPSVMAAGCVILSGLETSSWAFMLL